MKPEGPKMYSKLDIENVLQKAGSFVKRPVEAFLIGGCAMTFRNLKPATKDADLLLEDELSEKILFDALRESGLTELFPGAHQIEVKAKDILITKDGLQFDLFAENVLRGLSLTQSMKKRAEKHAEYRKLKVYLASKEDIYLFKAITDRPYPRDYEDMITLQQSGLNWKEIVSGFEEQIQGKAIEQKLRKKLGELKQQGYINPLARKLKM